MGDSENLSHLRDSENLAVVDAGVDDLEAEGFVGALGGQVGEEGVGGHLAAVVAAGPVLGGGEELAADALAAEGLFDKPAFDEADGVGGVAAVGVGAEADFEKSSKRSGGHFCDEEGVRHSRRRAAVEQESELAGVLLDRGVGPESGAHGGERIEVGGRGATDDDVLR